MSSATTGLVQFFIEHHAELGARLTEHIYLVLASTLVAAAIGLPLGITAARHRTLGRPLIALANLAQTIPSLALLGFLIPLPFIGGIGTRTALVALTLYAVLPIARTTLAGLHSVDAAVRESAVAMGMTAGQILWRVELPLALPSIAAGVRVAVVAGVGTATIASAIGAGGLGDYIFRGLAMVDSTVILAGAIPAALLALVADALLAFGAAAIDPRARRRATSKRRVWLVAAATVAAAVLVAVSAVSLGSRAAIVVGSKNFTEQVLLGEILAQTFEDLGSVTVERRLNLGGTLICDAALRRGDIDVYVEYTGTALTAIFNQEPTRDRDAVFEEVRRRYSVAGLSVLPRLGFNSTFAVLVREESAREYQLRSISDLTRVMSMWRAGFGFEFLERADGFPGLSRLYGLTFREPPRVMDLSLIYRALDTGELDVIAGDATSGLIDSLGLVPLADDRSYFPPYDAVPVASVATLGRYPQMQSALSRLAGRITESEMRRMNQAVDGDRRSYQEVAREFVATLPR